MVFEAELLISVYVHRVNYMGTAGSSHQPAEFACLFVKSELLLLLLPSAETHAHMFIHARPVLHSDLNKSTLIRNVLTEMILLGYCG